MTPKDYIKLDNLTEYYSQMGTVDDETTTLSAIIVLTQQTPEGMTRASEQFYWAQIPMLAALLIFQTLRYLLQ